jgi:hypothetical protein
MSSEIQPKPGDGAQPTSRGPNLVVIYGILAFALIAAMAIAALIVLPFYRHR